MSIESFKIIENNQIDTGKYIKQANYLVHNYSFWMLCIASCKPQCNENAIIFIKYILFCS